MLDACGSPSLPKASTTGASGAAGKALSGGLRKSARLHKANKPEPK